MICNKSYDYTDVGTHWSALYVQNIEIRILGNNSIMCGYFCIRFIDFMLGGKTFIDYTILFTLSYDFEKNDNIILDYLKRSDSIETEYLNLWDQTKFRLNEINKIMDYFNSEIQEVKTMSKSLSKYIAAFDYFDKALIVLSATLLLQVLLEFL